jgi:hypothetical protein
VAVSRHIDALAVNKVGSSYPPSLLHDALKETEKVKARLLYYYPLDEESDAEQSEDSWVRSLRRWSDLCFRFLSTRSLIS